MYTRLFFRLLAVTMFATPLMAQTPTAPTAKPARPTMKPLKNPSNRLTRHINDRLQFMRKMYTLDKQQLAKLQAEMTALAGEDKAYMAGRQMRLRRLSKAILLALPNQPDMTDTQRETIRKKFQRQIHDLYAEAPLSYANVAKLAEKSLGKQQIAGGRKQIASSFAKQLAGATVDINTLDALVIAPLRPAPKVAVVPTRATNPSPKQPPHDHASHAGRAHVPQAKLPPPPAGKISALRAPKPIVAAPPVGDWPNTLEISATKYGFSAQQNQSAQAVLASCRARAESHLTAHRADYDKANQLADAQARAAQIKKLNASVDRLYHEMNQRIDSIASIEQRLASQAAATKKPPAEKKPARKPEEKKTTAKADTGKPGT